MTHDDSSLVSAAQQLTVKYTLGNSSQQIGYLQKFVNGDIPAYKKKLNCV